MRSLAVRLEKPTRYHRSKKWIHSHFQLACEMLEIGNFKEKLIYSTKRTHQTRTVKKRYLMRNRPAKPRRQGDFIRMKGQGAARTRIPRLAPHEVSLQSQYLPISAHIKTPDPYKFSLHDYIKRLSSLQVLTLNPVARLVHRLDPHIGSRKGFSSLQALTKSVCSSLQTFTSSFRSSLQNLQNFSQAIVFI